MTTSVPEETVLYRRLLEDLTVKFGGSIDEANADAIAFAAADLYHRDEEPRLWEEKSPHDLLDLFGVPRAGVFAPYSLTERLVLLQRRASGAEHVARAHEVLDALEISRQDREGNPRPLSTRLKTFLAEAETAGDPNGGQGAPEPPEGDTGLEPAPAGTDGSVADQGNGAIPAANEAVGNVRMADEAVDENLRAAGVEPGDEPEGEATSLEPGDEPEERQAAGVEPGDAPEEDAAGGERPVEAVADEERAAGDAGARVSAPAAEEADIEITEEPGAAPLVDAIRALEQAAREEAELSGSGAQATQALDLVRLDATMSGVQAELVALRTLVQSLRTELQESIRAVQEELVSMRAKLGQEPVPPGADAVTQVLPSVPGEDAGPAAQAESAKEAPPPTRRPLRRVLLIALLILLGLMLAGVIVLAVAYGWHLVTTEVGGVSSSGPGRRVLASWLAWPCPPFPLHREERPVDLRD